MTSAGQMHADAAGMSEVVPGRSPAAPIDRDYLARFTLGNASLEREILELFAGQMPHYVAQLRAARTGKEWAFAAHTIKGSALAVGAELLARAAQAAESLDVEADPADSRHERRDAIAAVAAASEDACRYVAGLFAAA